MARHARGIRDANDRCLGKNWRVVEVRTDPRLDRCINNGGQIVIVLSKEIQQAVRAAKENPVRLIDPETHVEYVVLTAEKFTHMQEGFCYYDDSPLTEEEQDALLIEFGHRAGWDDPEMDIYNDLAPREES